jgi:glycosyltransferase involved in cell wall biosynthesis
MGLSVVITTFNEAENIANCIRSVENLADEIVLMDNFSTDGTTELARSLQAKVFQRKFDNFSENKNAAIEKASNEWILILDADEQLTPELQREIKNRLASGAEVDAFRIKRDTYFCGRKVRCWSHGSVVRLFRKNRAHYNPAKFVHEELIVDGGVQMLQHPMKHYTFQSYEQYLPKVHFYTTLSAREAYQRGERASWFSLWLLPPVRFIKTYFFKSGILDGIPGLLIAYFSAYSVYLKMAKLWELQASNSPKHSDGEK